MSYSILFPKLQVSFNRDKFYNYFQIQTTSFDTNTITLYQILQQMPNFQIFILINQRSTMMDLLDWLTFINKFNDNIFRNALERRFKITNISIFMLQDIILNSKLHILYFEWLLLEKLFENKIKICNYSISCILKTKNRDYLLLKLNQFSKLTDIKSNITFIRKVITDKNNNEKHQIIHYYFDEIPISNNSAKLLLSYIDKFISIGLD